MDPSSSSSATGQSVHPLVIQLLEDRDGGRSFSKHVIVAKLVLDKRFSVVILKGICSRAWNLTNRLESKELGNNIVLLSFKDPDDRLRVMLETSWSIGHPLVIKEWHSHLALKDIDFSISECWVQVHGLNPTQLSKDKGWIIGNLINSCVRVEMTDDNRLSYSGILRLRVLFNVLKPLLPGFFCSKSNGDQCWVAFVYERMSDFCYNCGMLDHHDKTCKQPLLSPFPPFTPLRKGVWMNVESSFYKWLLSKSDCDLRKKAGISPKTSPSRFRSMPPVFMASVEEESRVHARAKEVCESLHKVARDSHDETVLALSQYGPALRTREPTLDPQLSNHGDLSSLRDDLSHTSPNLTFCGTFSTAESSDASLVNLRSMSFETPAIAASIHD
ncbi:hypothetical protein Tsubulata_038035 [Turnera subulata]|uniref:CCHC-type domain-containing protein n=1 Tax=Turnera subulata TaxID=218843 RepID=A0A9Q0F3Z4_9ROSI|nr:hypothetical protein Tsubulata_038035 [Turnera subulata]